MSAHPAGPRHAAVPAEPAPHQPESAAAAAALSGRIWPATARRGSDGQMIIGGVDVRDAVAEYGSPLFLLDRGHFSDLAAEYRAGYGDARVYYAGKAFLSGAIARWVDEAGLYLDVASGGELEVALRAGFPANRILLHGNNKSVAEIERALDAGVGRIVLDSFVEIVRVAAAAAERSLVADVLLRVTLGVEAHTHEFIATAHEDQKFGLSVSSGDALEGARRVLALPSLHLAGLHSHIGSQIFDAGGFEVAAHRMMRFAASLQSELDYSVREVNLGGGMGIAYTAHDDPPQVAAMAHQLRTIVAAESRAAALPQPQLAFEPGRALIGPVGITLYEVGTVKRVELDAGQFRTYVSVDGGMSDNIRTALYDAEYTVTLASRASVADPVLCRVVGKHCESGDIVVRDAWLPADLAPGDLLAVAGTGAYCRAMASNYNYLPKPAVVSVLDGATEVVLRRETLDDLFRLDPVLGGRR
jgi:diaminopimelate decarboxylase